MSRNYFPEYSKQQALCFSLKFYENSSMPRKRVLEIQKMISELMASVSQAFEACLEINEEMIKQVLNFCKNPFSDIQSEYRFFKILKDMKLYRDPNAKT